MSSPALPLSLMNRDRFLALFYDPTRFDIHQKTVMHLHVLRVDGGDFAVKPLFKELVNNSISYVLSRQNLQKMLSDPSRMGEFFRKTQTQFKTPDANAGEGGELLLYSFLEGHLGAPKILSKMELKTSSEHYVHGTDGVHLLEASPGNYQLIFGESKMYGDTARKVGSSAGRGVKAAFESMGKVQEDDFDFDTWLVESELLKESLDKAKVELLASILLPPASGMPTITKSNAFGVFIGFELDVTTYPFADHTAQEIESYLRELALSTITAEVETIRTEIQKRGLGGFQFHIYAVPFLKRNVNGSLRGIENIRIDLASELSGKNLRPQKEKKKK
ncbi:hypothetical protein NtRootA4_41530 (plasmid) [Arthrobacter sp. NtRootA4]|uniref:Anti-bacteriophage protein A/HamA C-terminal domain-containing protein n=1 Tax=Paenarthrobacter nicotinovorans TaxID=29320 RepID=Q8GAK2_PAENI|nr:DUF1837 domain-containing protein [Paenarthrobacter nicotinovorans]BCW12941.1 hypothetical protein NtRootA2_42230 [Arthrobacter sp. NtRootA2]BCW17174.1 hypothetical protein NtRootA4_41530 [Arthrobacter sp. NtRootA4]BCW25282.1 hypothetical protein NtRootC7_41490 [Arthrobacter sp. NtRootC7]BCW29644.1 hypothetical protein NtRootC45_42440 [Arthrobacter sp. NtRootC45]BCW33819.1 hypothetical protein NtRootD5_41500 [Arthrobacter sp. NtRootD5]